MKKLTRDNKKDLSHIDDRRKATVQVKEWDMEIDLCSMSAKDRQDFEMKNEKLVKQNKYVEQFALLCMYCIVDEHNERIYDKDEDVKELMNKDPMVLQKLFVECTKINTLTDESLEEEAKK